MDHLLLHSQNKDEKILFQLAPLVRGTILHRPSKECKSPYVADVVLDGSSKDQTVLVHSPSLGCSGLCFPNSIVMMQPTGNTKSKCTHRILLAEFHCGSGGGGNDGNDGNDGNEKIYVATHPRLAEDAVKYALRMDLIDELKGHRVECVKEQLQFGNSRFDFAGIGAQGRPFLLEVKCVPLADYEDIDSKERLKRNYNNTAVWNPLRKVGYFPDGYRKKKTDVISPRALKHVQELEAIALKGDIDTYLCFVIQRSDVSRFVVSCIDPIYRTAVKRAMDNGVTILTLQCHYDAVGVCTLINQNILDKSCFERN